MNGPVLLLVGVALVEALIVLFVTQDFTQGMTFIDEYGAVFVLIIIVQLLSPQVAAVIHNSRRVAQLQERGLVRATAGSEGTIA